MANAKTLKMRANRRAPKRKPTEIEAVNDVVVYFVVVRTRGGDRCPALALFNGQVCGFTDRTEAERDLADIRKVGAEAYIITDDALTGAVIKAFDKAREGQSNGE